MGVEGYSSTLLEIVTLQNGSIRIQALHIFLVLCTLTLVLYINTDNVSKGDRMSVIFMFATRLL